MKRYRFAFTALMLVMAGCSAKVEDGASIRLDDLHDGFEGVMIQAVARARSGKLTKPILVLDASGENAAKPVPLFELSWTGENNHRRDDADQLLDKAQVRLLSRDGSVPIYSYCFVENHAQVATRFCTETLIAEMKAQVARSNAAREGVK